MKKILAKHSVQMAEIWKKLGADDAGLGPLKWSLSQAPSDLTSVNHPISLDFSLPLVEWGGVGRGVNEQRGRVFSSFCWCSGARGAQSRHQGDPCLETLDLAPTEGHYSVVVRGLDAGARPPGSQSQRWL